MIKTGTVVYATMGYDTTEAIAWIKEQGLTKEDVRLYRTDDMVIAELKRDWHGRGRRDTEGCVQSGVQGLAQ